MRYRSALFGALVILCVVTVDPGGRSPFGPARWLAISTIGFAAGACALWTRSARLDPRTWRLWLLLLALLTTSALVNGDTWIAVVGHPDRHLGVVTWLLFWLLFSAGQLLDDRGRRLVVHACALAAGLLGAYATIELLVGRPIDVAVSTDRVLGPFGSAAFTGAAACLLVPITVGVAVDAARPTRVRIAGCVAAGLASVALVGSGARAAWLGLAVALVVAVVVRPPRNVARPRRPRSLIRVAIAVGVAVMAVAGTRSSDVLERDHGAASRLDEWQVALRVVADHPLIGVGPEGYRIAVAEGIDADYERAYGRDGVWPDRAHSAPLDVALAGGIVAGITWLLIAAAVTRSAVRLARRDDPMLRWMAVGTVAYLVQQLFLFPLAEVDPIFWLVAGMVVAADRPAVDTRRRRPVAAVAVVATALCVVALVAGVLDVAADRLAQLALQARADGDALAAIDAARRAVALRPDVVTYRLIAADVSLTRGTLADVDRALAQTGQALRWAPHDPFALDMRGNALVRRAAITGLAIDAEAALAHWQRLVRDDPHNARWQMQLDRAAALDSAAGG